MVRAQHPPSLHAHFMAVLGVLPDRFTAGGGGKEAAALPEGLGGASLGLGSFPHVSTFEGSRGLEAGDTGAQRLRGEGQGRPQDRGRACAQAALEGAAGKAWGAVRGPAEPGQPWGQARWERQLAGRPA